MRKNMRKNGRNMRKNMRKKLPNSPFSRVFGISKNMLRFFVSIKTKSMIVLRVLGHQFGKNVANIFEKILQKYECKIAPPKSEKMVKYGQKSPKNSQILPKIAQKSQNMRNMRKI